MIALGNDVFGQRLLSYLSRIITDYAPVSAFIPSPVHGIQE
jgi:hypothetical protein